MLRRPRVYEDDPHVRIFRWHLESGDGIFLVGNILQELLDGLRSTKQFDRLVALLEPYPLLDLDRQTYVAAARLQSQCRSKGVAQAPSIS